jgi:uncharacterized membrane protein
MLEYIYQITGLLLITFSLQSFLDKQNKKRLGTGLFWLIYGLSFCLGSFIPDWLTGLMILALTLIAAIGLFGIGTYQESDSGFKVKQALVFKNKLFLPALIVPVGTILWSQLTDISALVGLGLSSVLALTIAIYITKCNPVQSIHEGRRLLDTIGWSAILAQFLAALGYLFSQAGVGETVSQLVQSFIPDNNLLVYVMAYTFGMALFTIIMGNAFAAFAVITTGIGIPLLVVAEGGDPAIIGVLGMLSGYCGTLMTPMAANYNIVPAVLLELTNKHQIISTQFLPGLAMLAINTALMYTLGF